MSFLVKKLFDFMKRGWVLDGITEVPPKLDVINEDNDGLKLRNSKGQFGEVNLCHVKRAMDVKW